MKIAVVGLGYVGLANSVLLAQHNSVTAVDISQDRVAMVNARTSPIIDLELEGYLARKNLDANTDPMLSHINVGSGTDISILDLAQLVARTVGFTGEILTDPSRPDGTMRKLMDVSRLARMGWTARISLEEGVRDAWRWYLEHREMARV